MKKHRILALLLAIALMCSVLAACGGSDGAKTDAGQNDQPGQTQDTGREDDAQGGDQLGAQGSTSDADEGLYERKTAPGTLTVGIVDNANGFDRATSSSVFLNQLVFDTLFEIDPDTLEVVPVAVDSYEYLDDVTLRITLHDGIYFNNGEQMTGEDVLYTMERYITVGSMRSTYFEMYDFEQSFVDADDPLTFTLKYYEPFGPGISYLTFPINCKSWIEGLGEDQSAWWDDPCCSGPYECVESVSGAHTILCLREDYWGDTTGMAETITFKYYTEQSTMYIDYCNGTLDAAFGLSDMDMDRLIAGEEGHSNYVVAPKNDVYMIVLPEYVEAFQNEKVRQAFAHAIDMEQVRAAAFGSLSLSCQSTLPKTVKYSIDVGGAYDYDPELAAQLMEEAGYADGLTLDVVITNDVTTTRIAEAVQAYLAAINVTLSISSFDVPTAIAAFRAGETELSLKNCMEGAPAREPDELWNTMGATSTNISARITDEEFNSYLDAGLHNRDEQTRAQAYADAQNWLHESYWVLPICEAGYGYVYRDYIESLNVVSPSTPDLKYCRFVQ